MSITRWLVATAVLVAAGGCAARGPDQVQRPSLPPLSERVPITHRAIAAIALTHLPPAADVRASYQEGPETRAGRLGVDLRYRPGPGEDGDLVRVSLAPAFPAPECGEVARCDKLPHAGEASVLLVWDAAGEEEPGGVRILVERRGEAVAVSYSGPKITGDPRELDLPISVEKLVDVATDPLLRLRTSPAAVAAGNELDDWSGGEPPTPRRQWVRQTGDGLILQFVHGNGRPDAWHDPEASPYQGEFGPGTISGRVRRGATDDTGPETVDLLVSKRPPPWLTGNQCRGTTYPGRCRVVDDRTFGRSLQLWTPTSGDEPGELWIVQVRPAETVAARFTGGSAVREKPSAYGEVYDSGVYFDPSDAWGFRADPLVFLYDLPT